ncbi:aldehyde dehydrogenase family protein [Nocardia sp. alder85J]|uniref:aldehyde dehydrogenase family protein n=1 Tax=Nocardia sp. alder85J TaxID=2862949 RepID=UPI001CD5E700|nr:aldehyde dehydrogenase family protein [Nocardia sp. alder85J]MCX4095637.1 aldehyde dehydrogenase family protein [Nocardia sp. alder85J]
MYGRHEFFIGGEWVPPVSDAVIEILSPSTEQVIGTVPAAGADDVAAAVRAAGAARTGPWAAMDFEARAAVLEAAAAYIEAGASEIAPVLSADMGTPLENARKALVPTAARMIRTAIDCARSIPQRQVRRDSAGAVLVAEEPIGVVAALVPFNGPLTIAILKTAPALLAGCPVVLKPSELAPLGAFVLADALAAAGLPPGMFNLITGGAEAGAMLVSHSTVDMVSFTGSTAVGRKIAAAAGERLKRISMELGGKSAGIVLEDADLDLAARVIGSAFTSAGQYCRALTRVLAPRRRYDEVVEALVRTAKSVVPGDPAEPGTNMPALISAAQRDRVQSYVDIAVAEGARVVCGGRRPEGLTKGYFYEPTVIADATNDMTFVREEIFGPVVAVIPYDSVDEAVAIANDSEYGLSGAVFTKDERRGLDIALRVETGTTGVNLHGARSCAPCGGVKSSGIGQEHGPEGFLEFLSPKAILISEEMARELELSGVPSVASIR